MIEELVELSHLSLEEVDGSGMVEQGADQIGAGLGDEAQELGVMLIRFKLQESDGPA